MAISLPVFRGANTACKSGKARPPMFSNIRRMIFQKPSQVTLITAIRSRTDLKIQVQLKFIPWKSIFNRCHASYYFHLAKVKEAMT